MLRGLWCFLSLFQLPLLFLLLGQWARPRADTLPRAGRLAAGFLVLWAAEEALCFWAGVPCGAPRLLLTGDGTGGWLFLALAGCLLTGALLERILPRSRPTAGWLAALLVRLIGLALGVS